MFILRHLFFFVLQFTLASAVTVGFCVAITLHVHGWAYRLTPQFAQTCHDYMRFGVVAGALFCLVLFCYHLTRKGLEGQSDEPWNNTDNLG